MSSLKATLHNKLDTLETKRKKYNELLASTFYISPDQRRCYIHARNFCVKQIENVKRKLKNL